MSETTEKKKAPVKKTTSKKKTNTPIGYLNLELTLVSGDIMKLNSIAVFDKGNYVDKKAVRLVEVAKKRGGEMVQTMKCIVKSYTPAELPADELFAVVEEEVEV